MKRIIISQWIKFACFLASKRKNRTNRNVNKVAIFYRICDVGYKKNKPDYITKENCLRNAVNTFPLDKVDWYVLADKVCEETYQMILKYVPEDKVERVTVGHGAGTFRIIYEKALLLPDDTLVYFLEDDYLHQPASLSNLICAAEANIGDYICLYDHPDKYVNMGANPFVYDGGEFTKVFIAGDRHWKRTNSTTMTFASFVDTLKRDKKIFWRWTNTHHPYDFQIFCELRIFSKAYLVSPLPSLSTHGEVEFLAPVVDWEKVL